MKTILCYGDSNTWGYEPERTEDSPGISDGLGSCRISWDRDTV